MAPPLLSAVLISCQAGSLEVRPGALSSLWRATVRSEWHTPDTPDTAEIRDSNKHTVTGGQAHHFGWNHYTADANAYNRSFQCMEATPNRTFTCMEVTYPYAVKNQRKARNTPILSQNPLVGGFGCLELVLYGLRELA